MRRKKLKMIYVASPFSYKGNEGSLIKKKHEKEMEYHVSEISSVLHELYDHAFIMPITQSYRIQKLNSRLNGSFGNWADRDYEFISRCDQVWVVTLKGWKESTGVQAEIAFALKRKIPVFYITPTSLKKTIKPSDDIGKAYVAMNGEIFVAAKTAKYCETKRKLTIWDKIKEILSTQTGWRT